MQGPAAPELFRAEVRCHIARANPETVATDEALLGCSRPSTASCRTQGPHQSVVKSIAGGLWEKNVRLDFLSSTATAPRWPRWVPARPWVKWLTWPPAPTCASTAPTSWSRNPPPPWSSRPKPCASCRWQPGTCSTLPSSACWCAACTPRKRLCTTYAGFFCWRCMMAPWRGQPRRPPVGDRTCGTVTAAERAKRPPQHAYPLEGRL